MRQLITAIDQVTPEWLTHVLRKNGYLESGDVVAVQPGASSPAMGGGPGFRPSNRLQVSYSTDASPSAPSRLYLKTGTGERYKAEGPKEIEFYTSVSAVMPFPVAVRCYDAFYDTESGAYHLLLADVSETHRTVHPEGPATRLDTERMLDTLARLHAYWWGHPGLGEDVGSLPSAELVQQGFSQLRDAFPGYVDFLDDRLSVQRRAVYEQVLARYPDVLARRIADRQNLTLVHYDAHVGNFLLPQDPELEMCYIADWQQWGVLVGPNDVAYMIALFWYPERRMRLERSVVRHYYDCLLAYGVSGYGWDECWRDYRLGAIENLFVMFSAWVHGGWTEHWGYHRWHQLEKAMLAFHDLGCAELLEA